MPLMTILLSDDYFYAYSSENSEEEEMFIRDS